MQQHVTAWSTVQTEKSAGTPGLISPGFHHQVHSFVGMQFALMALHAPCKCKKIPCKCETVRVKEVLHLFRCYTHTHPACGGVWFLEDHRSKCRQDYSNTKGFSGANVHSRVQSLSREIGFKLKYLDRFTEAPAFNHSPRFVDFPRCHSSRQSGWKLFGQVLDLRDEAGCLRRCSGLNGNIVKRMMPMN